MPQFEFSLEALRKVREHHREQCLQVLAEVLSEDARLAEAQARLERERGRLQLELRQIQGDRAINVDQLAQRRVYAAQLLERSHDLERQRRALAERIADCRSALVQADREVKVLEQLRERQFAAFQLEHERRAALEAEDVWRSSRLAFGS